MDLGIITGVETSVMDGQPVNVAINPGWDPSTMKKGAVPPVQTAASKLSMVKLFSKQDTQKVNFFILLIFAGNVDCQQGSVLSIGEECPVLGQCLSYESFKSRPICEDPKTTETFCSKGKSADEICRGIPNMGCKE